MNKLRSRKGETLVETLVATMVIVITVMFLATAILSASRINRAIENKDTSFRYEPDSTRTAQIEFSDGAADPVNVTMNTNNGYYYYSIS